MRRAPRRDANEPAVIDALAAMGASVHQLDGKGTPDLLVGYRGKNYLMEVKDGDKPPSKRGLTDDQKRFKELWRGQVTVVTSPREAVEKLQDLAR